MKHCSVKHCSLPPAFAKEAINKASGSSLAGGECQRVVSLLSMVPTRAARMLLAVMLVLSGCASLQEPVTVSDGQQQQLVQQHLAALRAVSEWQAIGRIGVVAPDQTFTASLGWQQQLHEYRLSMTALLGQFSLVLDQTDAAARLALRGRPPTQGRDAEILLREATNLTIPLRQMPAWLRGLPGSDTLASYDDKGRVESLNYTDDQRRRWRADFLRYQHVDSRDMPALIVVTGNDLTIRLAIKQWTLGAASRASGLPAQPVKPDLDPTDRMPLPGV